MLAIYVSLFKILFSTERCNQVLDCTDGSDEAGCNCEPGEFQCHCYRNNPVTCTIFEIQRKFLENHFVGCIQMEKYHDDVEDCADGSDERVFTARYEFDNRCFEVQRFSNVNECNVSTAGSICNPETCYEVPSYNCTTLKCNTTQVICITRCFDAKTKEKFTKAFQCADGSLALSSHFCDNEINCPDNSDEIRNQFGFKCARSRNACVLPQRNLYDSVAHCEDGSDLCFINDTCFECLDKRLLISVKQVCDGFINCYDMSDEYLCSNNFQNPLCDATDKIHNISAIGILTDYIKLDNREYNLTFNNLSEKYSFHLCRTHNSHLNETKFKHTLATYCDGRLECYDLSDECHHCENPAPFCSDSCYSSFPSGNRYCDGIVDEYIWKTLNNSVCPRGFDESNCPHRFKCKAADKISIDMSEKCNGVVDCDDGSDEQDCIEAAAETIFSNEFEMIAHKSLQTAFWVIGILVIASNLYVIAITSKLLRKTKLSTSLQCQHLIILNISCADLIMGIYLFVIAIYSVIYSDHYGKVDYEWRTSFRCSLVGSLAILSSEASCFLMVILTSLRLYLIYKPHTSSGSSTVKWKIYIILAWLLAAALAIAPLLNVTSNYFVHSIWFENMFNKNGVWDKCNITQFSFRLARLSNTFKIEKSDWASVKAFLEVHFPKYSPRGEFGYYGETSVCMPRFYVRYGGTAWEYTFAIITINFISFICIAVSYLQIFMITRKSKRKISASIRQRNIKKQEKKMLQRISRIIFTDFACWIPICLMAYMQTGGVDINKIAYQISAVFLLPINSLLNPVLYSALLDKLVKNLRKK